MFPFEAPLRIRAEIWRPGAIHAWAISLGKVTPSWALTKVKGMRMYHLVRLNLEAVSEASIHYALIYLYPTSLSL